MATENRSDTFDIGGEDTVHRLGYGAMRLTGEEIIGPPDDEEEAKRSSTGRPNSAWTSSILPTPTGRPSRSV